MVPGEPPANVAGENPAAQPAPESELTVVLNTVGVSLNTICCPTTGILPRAVGTHMTALPFVIETTPLVAFAAQPGASGLLASGPFVASGRYIAALAVVLPAESTFCHGLVASIELSTRSVTWPNLRPS